MASNQLSVILPTYFGNNEVWTAAYNPMNVEFQSTRHPVNFIDPIHNLGKIGGATASEATSFGIAQGTLIAAGSATLPTGFSAYIKVVGTANYDGIYKIVNRFNTQTIQLDGVAGFPEELSVGTGQIYYNNYRVNIDLRYYVELPSASLEDLVSLSTKTYNSDGSYFIDISGAIQTVMGGYGVLDLDQVDRLRKTAKWEFDYYESYDGVTSFVGEPDYQVLTTDIITTDPQYSYDGLLPYVFRKFDGIIDFGGQVTTSWYVYPESQSLGIEEMLPLTNRPKRIKMPRNMPLQNIGFLVNETQPSDGVWARVTGNKTGTINDLVWGGISEPSELIAKFGDDFFGLGTDTFIYIDIRVGTSFAAGQNIIARYFVDIDDTCYRDAKIISWRNPFGCYDMAYFTGRTIYRKGVKKTVSDKHMTVNKESNIIDADKPNPKTNKVITNVDTSDIITVNSGLVDRETAQWMSEIYDSPDVFLIERDFYQPDKFHAIPIVVQDGSFDIRNSHDALNNIGITFTYGYPKNIQRG